MATRLLSALFLHFFGFLGSSCFPFSFKTYVYVCIYIYVFVYFLVYVYIYMYIILPGLMNSLVAGSEDTGPYTIMVHIRRRVPS